MDVIEELKTQHRVAEHLFEEIHAAHAPEAKERLLRELLSKLNEHMLFEESVFYPAVEKVNPSLVVTSYDDHAACKALFDELQGLPGSEAEFTEKLMQVKQMIEDHVQVEEQILFAQCLSQLDEALLSKLGLELEEWSQRSSESMREPGNADVNMSPS